MTTMRRRRRPGDHRAAGRTLVGGPRRGGGAAMSTATPYGYALRVDGHLDRHWRSRFGDLELTHHDDGTSTLAGPVADQSQLHGLLAGLRDIGATLLSVRPVDQPDPDKRSPPPRSTVWAPRTERSPCARTRDDAEPTWRFRRQESVGRWLTAVPHSLGTIAPRSRSRTVSPPPSSSNGTVVIGDLMLKIEAPRRGCGAGSRPSCASTPSHRHGYETERPGCFASV